MSAATPVAFVGIGRMGAAMLQAVVDDGNTVAAYDVDPDAAARFHAAHPDRVRVAASAADAAAGAAVVDVVVNTDAQVRDACLGDAGVVAGAAPGTVVLIHSTITHDTLREVAAAARARDVHVLDAPVSGPLGHRSVPDLCVMCGGAATAFERARPVLDAYGGLVVHLGDLGAGLDAKLALNVLRYLLYVASQEVMRFVARTGVDPALFRALADQAGAVQLTGDFSVGRQVEEHDRLVNNAETAQKDFRAAIARAAEVGLDLPASTAAIPLMHGLWGVEPPTDRTV